MRVFRNPFFKKCLIVIFLGAAFINFNTSSKSDSKDRSKRIQGKVNHTPIMWQAGQTPSEAIKSLCFAYRNGFEALQFFNALKLFSQFSPLQLANFTKEHDKCPLFLILDTRIPIKSSTHGRLATKNFIFKYKGLSKIFNGTKFPSYIYLQISDEPKMNNHKQSSRIKKACAYVKSKGYKSFLSINRIPSQKQIEYLDCIDWWEYHNHYSASTNPLQFWKSVLEFDNVIASFRNLSVSSTRKSPRLTSISLPMFFRVNSRKGKTVLKLSTDDLISKYCRLGYRPGLYGAYLSTNIGFMQSLFLEQKFKNFALTCSLY